MSTATPISERLRTAREAAGLNQHGASRALDLDRVNISYWENGKRTPSVLQLQQLAQAYGTTVEYLLGQADDPAFEDEHAQLYAHLGPDESRARAALKRWLRFLDEWADLLEEADGPLPGRGKPPRAEWRTEKPITDSRRAPTLAGEVRQEYKLGLDAIPDLASFLDAIDVLVTYAGLGEDSEISGVFYNHPRLGYCILVNEDHRRGRQLFTLAHEFAHALFHHQELGLVSRGGQRDPKEFFANTFAGHFLVPSETLRQVVKVLENEQVDDPYDVVWLQSYFRVSYAMLLTRLYSEGLIEETTYETYKGYKPTALARRLGLDIEDLQDDRQDPRELRAYPRSVIDKVVRFIHEEVLSPQSAASLLAVPLEVILELLARPEPASLADAREFAQLPEPTKPKRKAVSRG